MCIGSEEPVGKAIRESDVPREEIFVTTKLAYVPVFFFHLSSTIDLILICRNTDHAHVSSGFETSLAKLGLD